MAIDIEYLSRAYFYFDDPVPYELNNVGAKVFIRPISLRSSELFLSSIDILTIDKNSISDVDIIQMSYLRFIYEILLKDMDYGKINGQKFANILILCLGLKEPYIKYKNNLPFICDKKSGIEINQKQFDDIKKIILYQNIPHYDDEYINPEFKKAMNELDELESKNKIVPTLERKIAIITARSGLSKKEQLDMTYRSHCLLFEEVCGEVNYSTARAAVLAGSGKDMDPWIFKDKKGKFDKYIKSVESYKKDIGGAQAFRTTDTSVGDSYMEQYNNFNK